MPRVAVRKSTKEKNNVQISPFFPFSNRCRLETPPVTYAASIPRRATLLKCTLVKLTVAAQASERGTVCSPGTSPPMHCKLVKFARTDGAETHGRIARFCITTTINQAPSMDAWVDPVLTGDRPGMGGGAGGPIV